ncbi:MAG: YchF/TatD family DNA exonuclease [Candidatus Aminicenantes bacterium]|nr:YchF/TatD family DNA exonuclease [Candidatus Aminicenantes bacterium]
MKIIDSHAHLNTKDFDEDRDQVLEQAFDSGIKTILCPTEVTDEQNIQTTFQLLERYDQICAAGGVHPHHARLYNDQHEHLIKDMAERGQIVAVGEIGLDFHYNHSTPSKQKLAFQKQLSLAQKLELPVIIHSRSAASDVLACIKKQNFNQGGILHCFTENFEFARTMIETGFYISFSGILTYPRAHDLREIAKKIPSEKLLVETDAPFLTPVPFRNKIKRNEPAFVVETAQVLAELKKMSYKSLAEQMCQNFSSLFKFEISNF